MEKKKLSAEQVAKLKAQMKEIETREMKEWLLSHNPNLSGCIKQAIYYTLYYVLHNRNHFNELSMTKEDLNTVTGYVDLFEESRAEDGNVLIQSIQGVLDRLVETSDKEIKQDIANEFITMLKKDSR